MTQILNLVLGVVAIAAAAIIIFIFLKRRGKGKDEYNDTERNQERGNGEEEREELVSFHGGEDLTIVDILEAPGEVIGKASHGTLYKAYLQGSSTVRLLRFLRPLCTAGFEAFVAQIEFLGSIRHRNLVPLLGFYSGPRTEKLLIHPFYRHGNLAQFIRGKEIHISSYGSGSIFIFPDNFVQDCWEKSLTLVYLGNDHGESRI